MTECVHKKLMVVCTWFTEARIEELSGKYSSQHQSTTRTPPFCDHKG